MPRLVWDETGKRFYETGVDRGVLYIPNAQGLYTNGVAWNGLTSVSESPSGAEPNAQYADNIKYLNLFSAEEFSATVEAFTYPDEFAPFDGLQVPTPGVAIGQQARRSFGLSYRTKVGNDVEGEDFGYKLHMIYGCYASPSEKAYNTINDSPEAINFSWEISTNPVAVADLRPTSLLTVDSTKVSADALAYLENILYGAEGSNPRLPLPDAIVSIFNDADIVVTPIEPTFDPQTNTISIPVVSGVTYEIDNDPVTGDQVITEDTLVVATADEGYVFPAGATTQWFFEHQE